MPKHIVSGLKYLTAVELIRDGFSQKDVAKILEMNKINCFALLKW